MALRFGRALGRGVSTASLRVLLNHQDIAPRSFDLTLRGLVQCWRGRRSYD